MASAPRCYKVGLNRGAWSATEDSLLTNFIQQHGEGQWRSLPKKAGLLRCGRSCRLRWMNYLRPGIKRGNITKDEEDLILRLHRLLGNRWSLIAGRLPGRTDNEIKNYWNTHLHKKLKDAPITLRIPPRDLSKLESTKQKQNQVKQQQQKKMGEEKENDLPNTTRLYFPKPIRVTSALSRSGSYNSLASGASCGSDKAAENVPREWPALFEIEGSTFGVNNGGSGEDDFLGGREFAPPVLSRSESISDDAELLEKVYDDYLQLL